MSRASRRFDRQLLAQCTMYTSTEPCAMCAGSVYWVGVRRVVYGLSEKDLLALTGSHEDNPTFDLPCRTVFAGGQRPTEVIGPLLTGESSSRGVLGLSLPGCCRAAGRFDRPELSVSTRR